MGGWGCWASEGGASVMPGRAAPPGLRWRREVGVSRGGALVALQYYLCLLSARASLRRLPATVDAAAGGAALQTKAYPPPPPPLPHHRHLQTFVLWPSGPGGARCCWGMRRAPWGTGTQVGGFRVVYRVYGLCGGHPGALGHRWASASSGGCDHIHARCTTSELRSVQYHLPVSCPAVAAMHGGMQ